MYCTSWILLPCHAVLLEGHILPLTCAHGCWWDEWQMPQEGRVPTYVFWHSVLQTSLSHDLALTLCYKIWWWDIPAGNNFFRELFFHFQFYSSGRVTLGSLDIWQPWHLYSAVVPLLKWEVFCSLPFDTSSVFFLPVDLKKYSVFYCRWKCNHLYLSICSNSLDFFNIQWRTVELGLWVLWRLCWLHECRLLIWTPVSGGSCIRWQ